MNVSCRIRSSIREIRGLALGVIAAILISVGADPLFAQQPSSSQIQGKLETDPQLAARLRAEIARGGLTAAQVRARLRAAGYPESLLDQYLSDSTDGTSGGASRDSVLNAVRALGLADSTVVDALRATIPLPGDSSGPVRQRVARGQDGLPIFGLDIFRSETNRFEPTLAGGVGPDYRLGPGDVLAVILTGDVERAYSLDISREGFVLIPQVGQVYVANLSVSQAQDVLLSRLRQSYSGLSRSPNAATRLFVTVARLHTNQVFVIGEVIAPGNYRISSVGTVLTALYAAGGPNDNGTLRRVQVRRGGQVVGTIDLYDYLVRGDASKDIRLESGDVVFVGVQNGRVSIRGPVMRPAVYEILPGETLTELIQTAGGFTAEAAQQRVQVRRVLPPSEREPGGRDRVVLDVAPANFAAGNAPPFLLAPGDRVEVFPITSPERNSIVVVGDVWSPGLQGFKAGMTLSAALRAAGGVRPDVFLGQILISRVESDRTRKSLHAALRDSLGTVEDEIMLKEDDSIHVYSRTDFTPERHVAIAGAVRKGGQYSYRTGMTLRELLLQAGGPLESADLREAEIGRFPANRGRGVLAQAFRVPLDSSYLFERRPDGSFFGPPGVSLPADRAPEVELKPYDNVLIFRQPGWRLLGAVTLTGEVRSPGSYTITSLSERISDVLVRAGGLTPQGDPDAMIFYRRADSAGRIGVNLRDVMKNSRSKDNFTVQAGDSIIVSAFKPYVRVTGAVNSPVSVAYIRGESVLYYVRAAGGATQKADVGRSYVRQPNGSVEATEDSFLKPTRSPVPKAGATIVVPEKDPNQKTDFAAMAGVIAPIVASTITLLALILRR